MFGKIITSGCAALAAGFRNPVADAALPLALFLAAIPPACLLIAVLTA